MVIIYSASWCAPCKYAKKLFDVPNNKKYTMSKHELWHSDLEYPGDNDWPENWSEKF